jgi:hypothetical protein
MSTGNAATLTLPPAEELEARLQVIREEAARVKKLLKVRRDLDAAEEARRQRLQADPAPTEQMAAYRGSDG